LVDDLEVGRRVSSGVRFAIRVDDLSTLAELLERAGAERLSAPVTTPWGDVNVRLQAPDGMQLTLFTSADEA
jgi:lactoylglutathione lyase